MAELQAGTAVANITPPVRTHLAGYAGRADASRGIHDDLMARALVLDDGATRLAIVACDLLALDRDLVAHIRERAAEEASIPPGHIMLACSHTHSGPSVPHLRRMGEVDRAYLETLERKIAGAMYEACSRLAPARCGFGSGAVNIGINRRQPHDGATILGVNAAGPVDPQVGVLRVDHASGELLAVAFNYACHAVVMGGDNLMISADYPGAAAGFVARALGDRVTSLFLAGCGGDVNPVSRGSFDQVDRLGGILGAEVVRVTLETKTSVRAPLRAASEVIDLPVSRLPNRSRAREILTQCRAELRQAEAAGRRGPELDAEVASVEWAEALLEAVRKRGQDLTEDYEVQVFRVGSGALVALPSETFVEIGLDIKRRSPFATTLTVGTANGCIGYLPTEAAHAEGGYEVESAPRFYGLAAPAPTAAAMVEETAAALLQRVRRERRKRGRTGRS